MDTIEVFAEVACPFAHVGLRRFVAERERRGRDLPRLRVRAWPLELVNRKPFEGRSLAPEIAALRAGVAPNAFVGFDPDRFPATTLPALAAEAAAHRTGSALGEAFSLAIRDGLFERGLDVGDPEVLGRLLADAGLPPASDDDVEAVHADHRDGIARGVSGSPHFFTDGGDFFCPSLDIEHGDDGVSVTFDHEGFDRFVAAAFGSTPR